jgi:hypothetical protein
VELRRPQLEQAPQLQGGNEGVSERIPRDGGDRRDGLVGDLCHEDGTVGDPRRVKVGQPPERGLVVCSRAADRHRVALEMVLTIAAVSHVRSLNEAVWLDVGSYSQHYQH